MADKPFWQTKTLGEMTPAEWESLCDGCGLCCLVRFEEEVSGDIIPTRVHCKLFDNQKCRCTDYEDRHRTVPDCIKLEAGNIDDLFWMPKSCAYRRLNEGKSLPRWHHLITGDRETVHELGISVRGQTISETALARPDDALDFEALDLLRDRGDD